MLDELRAHLAAGGLDVVAVADAAPLAAHLAPLHPAARAVIVVGSGGRALWERFTAWAAADFARRFRDEPHPLDRYVAGVLDGGDAILARAGVSARRLEPTVLFAPRVDFRRLAAAARLGGDAPLGMVVHPVYGPWWALRGAWLVDRALAPTPPLADPCRGCPAPCRAAIAPGAEGTIWAATREARLACVLQAHRYLDEQLAYHYRPDEGRALVAARLQPR